jgi:hypothetical protein
MHYLPDTNDQDAVQERYWPDGFKQVIRNELSRALSVIITAQSLRHIYQRHYTDTYPDINRFVETVINSVIVGAENGADRGFEAVYSAFLAETPLPQVSHYVRHLWPDVMTAKTRHKILNAVVRDYTTDDGFSYAYKDGYHKDYVNYSDFINAVSDTIVSSIANGIDDALEKIYIAFISGYPLPPLRRNPKRLKTW